MKYGLIATTMPERLAMLTGQVPVPVLDALYPLVKTRALMAAVRLGVFEAMGEGWHHPEALAAQCHLDPSCLALLLRTLVNAGYAIQQGDRYALSKLAQSSMIAGSQKDLTSYLEWSYTQWELLGGLERLLQTGQGSDFHHTLRDSAQWTHYQRGMLELARRHAPLVARKVPVKVGAKRLVDVAGSHGLFGAEICRRHPPMTSTVIELPEAFAAAQELARAENIDHLVEHRAGNLFVDDFGDSDVDVVLFSNILHHFSAEQNVLAIARARRAMTTGATVAIWDFDRPRDDETPTFSDAAALFFRLTSNGSCFRASDHEQWLRTSGFVHVRSLRSRAAPAYALTVGIVPTLRTHRRSAQRFDPAANVSENLDLSTIETP